jgi:transposase InsO family protein
VAEAFEASAGTYGSPRITLELQAAGWRVSANTVAQLMRQQGLVARVVRRRRSLTRQGTRPAAADLVQRRFTAAAPDTVWVGDVTMIRTGEGPLYLATVLDLFSRRLLGYATSTHHDAELTTASLQMAATVRGGQVDGVIFHSDRGSEYTAADYAAVCDRLGVVQSMGRVASALDNAAAEAVNSILKTEYVYRHSFATREQARLAVGRWIDRFYNTRRRHSWCGGISPIDYEHQHKINTAATAAA